MWVTYWPQTLLLSAAFPLFAAVPAGAPSAQGVGSGTTVIVIRTPKAILAAVDSRETWNEYSNGAVRSERRTVCKVRRIGPFYAMVAGAVRGSNGFDALDIAAGSWSPGIQLKDLAARIAVSLPPVLTPLLQSVKDADPEGYATTYAGQIVMQTIVIGSEQGATAAALIEFAEDRTQSSPPTLSTSIRMCPGDCSGRISTMFLGIHGEIDDLVSRDHTMLTRPPEDLAQSLIAVESDAHPDTVGGPVSIIRFGKSGGEIVRGGACAFDRESR